MGFPREAATEALAASGGSIPDAAYRLLTPGMMPSTGTSGPASVAAAEHGAERHGQAFGEGGSSGNSGGGQGGGRLPRDVRLQQAADRIAAHEDPARAVQVRVLVWRQEEM